MADEHTSSYLAYYALDLPDLVHEHHMEVVRTGDHAVALQYFLPRDAVGRAIVCHGYYDHIGLYGHLIAYLLSRRLGVIAFDQIGHGLSGGAPVVIDHFDSYVRATGDVVARADEHLGSHVYPGLQDGQPLHWIAQSMGGSVAMEYLHQHADVPRGEVVLLAPLVRPYAWWLNRWVFAVAKRTIEERPRTIMRNAANEEFMALQMVDPLQARTLPVAWVDAMVRWFKRFEAYPPSALEPKIVQGHADRTVSWRYNEALLRRRYPAARWRIIEQASHHLVNESESIRSQIWHWLDDVCNWTSGA